MPVKTSARVEYMARRLRVPEWFIPSLIDRRAWKNFARCEVTTLACLVLLVCQPSLNKLGQAAFFGALLSQVLPPNMALSIYIFALSTLSIGMLFGWAWGSAAMAAALRARNPALLAKQQQDFQAGLNQNMSIPLQQQYAIFHGSFLDPRSSAVYGVFFFVGTYLFGYLRAAKPRLTLASLFGTIILDLMVTIGPLFPVAQYTLAKQLLLPAVCFVAIALASSILVFPQTLNHIILGSLIKTMLTPTIALVKLQDDVLSISPHDTDKWSQLAEKVYTTKHKHIKATTAISEQMGLLQLEMSRGQIGSGDLENIFTKLKELGWALYGLTNFTLIIEEQNRTLEKSRDNPIPHPIVNTHQHLQQMEQHSDPSRTLQSLLPILNQSTLELRQTCVNALQDIQTWLLLVNHTRWKKIPKSASPTAQREENLAKVKSVLQVFRESGQYKVFEPYRDLFDPQTGALKPHLHDTYRYMTRDLFRSLILTANTVSFSLTLVSFLELLLEIEKRSPTAKMQFPTRFTKKLVESANDQGGENPLDMGLRDAGGVDGIVKDERSNGIEEMSTASERGERRVYKMYPDASDPRNAFQRIGRHIYTFWQNLVNPTGIYALKYSIASMALFVPAVCPQSAWFYYSNRGLWALIMGQAGMGIFTGEQIITFLIRMGGTIAGLVIGMLVWYLGAARGSGNPYGVVAATMVLTAPCLFIRVVIPIQQAVFFVMTNVTIVFVVGYSWSDEHIVSVGNQGSGAGLAGRRGLLVIIGFTVALILMLFPQPLSARTIFRRRLAKNIGDIADLYRQTVTNIENEVSREEWKEDGRGRRAFVEEKRQLFMKRLVKVMGRMMAMEPHLSFAAIEPGLQGPWPKELYTELYHSQARILATLSLLFSSFTRLEADWCARLARRSDLLHPAFIGDCVLLFSTLQQSLRTGESLPPMIPIFERLAIISRSSSRRVQALWADQKNDIKADRDGEQRRLMSQNREDGEEEMEWTEGDVRNAKDLQVDNERRKESMEEKNTIKVMAGAITWDNCHSEQFALVATANTALIHTVLGLHEMYRTVRGIVGEREFQGLDKASERWAREELV
ncbi:hypothetical protein L204_104640 [Cryptococcus depauperatus]|nr:hypothetical protein L204_03504 [Cryptococcus depauperatus CBS 7855]